MLQRPIRSALVLAALALPLSLLAQAPASSPQISAAARQLHMSAIVVDTHADTPQRMLFEKGFDMGQRHTDGQIDIPRMREGGLDAEFFSIWVPSTVTGPPAIKRALDLIDAVRESVRHHPNDMLLATSVADIRKAVAEHKIAALMGVEGGHMIDDDLGVLRMYHDLGVRYMTLTHFLDNDWADSSTDKPKHNGLTPFGKDVVREMNRLGVMVDISHVSDKTFYDAIAVSKAPVIASHSSARAIAHHPRNMTDDMMRALAKNGGVIDINYEASFLSEAYRVASDKLSGDVVKQMDDMDKKCGGDEACVTTETNRINHEAMMSGNAAEGVLDGNRRPHRPCREDRRRRSRRPRLGLRRLDDAAGDGERGGPAEDHPGAAEARLLTGGHPEDPRGECAEGVRGGGEGEQGDGGDEVGRSLRAPVSGLRSPVLTRGSAGPRSCRTEDRSL